MDLSKIFSVARYGLSNILLAITIAGVIIGGGMLWLAVAAIVATAIADDVIGDDVTTPPIWGESFYNVNLYVAVPLLCILAMAHAVWAKELIERPGTQGIAPLAEFVAATAIVAYQYALIGATIGHELIHRTHSRFALFCSTLLLAFTCNTGFTIFHIRGHHPLVATWDDPASARRGESWSAFLLRSTSGQARMAFQFEKDRLGRDHRRVLSLHNRFLTQQLYSLAIAAISFLIGGIAAMAAFIAAAVLGRCLHELVNYVQHCGLVRAPGEPVAPRHSWNCYRSISNGLQYNLPYHSGHHLWGSQPFWKLRADENAPTLPYGYQTMATIALVPPLWHRLMRPRLAQWDDHFASEAERAILKERACLNPALSNREPSIATAAARVSLQPDHAG